MQKELTIFAMFGASGFLVSGYSFPSPEERAAPSNVGSNRMFRNAASSPDAASKIVSSIVLRLAGEIRLRS